MKVGILGGTFDPIHEGHLTLARSAMGQYGLDKVIFIPACIPPNKTDRKNMTPASERLRMVEMALQHEPSFELSEMELERSGISYTVDTLVQIKERFPDDELFLILGFDTLSEIPSWRDCDQIAGLARFLVARRGPLTGKIPFRENVQWIDMDNCPLSSSIIREKIQLGLLAQGDLPPGVESYIRKQRLYGGNPTCS
ncbi:MAG: nicotinate-nucleotide adenylyltransferase [Candidatus Omnitrophota bacterium]|nr:nicotinate-nucleotide adenylyltransferase [Candidatus Omnitrophota bacterium]